MTPSLGLPRFLFTVAVLFAVCQWTHADTYYVGPNGNDSRSRSTATNRNLPLRTMQRAVSLAQPGDEIVVLDGRYFGLVYFQPSGRADAPIILR